MTIREVNPQILLSREYKDNCIYVKQNKKLYEIVKPSSGFGSTTLSWQHGRIVRVETTTSEIFPDE